MLTLSFACFAYKSPECDDAQDKGRRGGLGQAADEGGKRHRQLPWLV